jgi:hypothetical protein
MHFSVEQGPCWKLQRQSPNEMAANALASKIIVQNARYRTDIGMKLIDGNLARLEILQVFDPA